MASDSDSAHTGTVEEDSWEELSQEDIRRVYLITYSRCDLERFPTRESFAAVVARAFFDAPGAVVPKHWACCREPHRDNNGEHYHLCISLSGPRRWFPIKEILKTVHQIVVNFRENDGGYNNAYSYVCKSDRDVYHSDPHPNIRMIGSPSTKAAMKSYAQRRQKRKAETTSSAPARNTETACSSAAACAEPPAAKSCHRLTVTEVASFCIENNIRSRKALCKEAELQKRDGKLDLYTFVLVRKRQSIEDLIETAWYMHHSLDDDREREDRDRIHVLFDLTNSRCVPGCEDQRWKRSALQLLEYNNIDWVTFAEAIKTLLRRGRGKYRNLMLVGEANCGKSFLFEPLKNIYKVFDNPARDRFCWIGADEAEVILINDFRWKGPEQISWEDLLRLLEGQNTKLPAPKNHFAKDIVIDKDTPIFATGPYRIRHLGVNNDRENQMMEVRWRVFHFYRRLTQEEIDDTIPPCPRCFADFVLRC